MISARSFAQAFAPRLRHRQCLPAVRPDPARGVAPFAVGLGAPRGGEAFTREATAARAASCRRPRIAAKDLVPPALPRRRPYAGDAAVGADEILIDVMAAPDEGRCVVSAVIARETGRIDGHAAAGNFRALACAPTEGGFARSVRASASGHGCRGVGLACGAGLDHTVDRRFRIGCGLRGDSASGTDVRCRNCVVALSSVCRPVHTAANGKNFRSGVRGVDAVRRQGVLCRPPAS